RSFVIHLAAAVSSSSFPEDRSTAAEDTVPASLSCSRSEVVPSTASCRAFWGYEQKSETSLVLVSCFGRAPPGIEAAVYSTPAIDSNSMGSWIADCRAVPGPEPCGPGGGCPAALM